MAMVYTINNLTKTYGEGEAQVVALNNVSLEIPEGKLVTILGASGSGKSTLLNMMGCMDKPDSGEILFGSEDIVTYSRPRMTDFRRDHIGFVFQSYNLLPDLTALENVEFSTEMAGLSRDVAIKALKDVDLEKRLDHYPSELSGGEQQRVSIARAIAKSPKILLCDEPTGALDFHTGAHVLEVLQAISQETNTTVVLITHNREIAKMADMVITIGSGEVESIYENENPLHPNEVHW